MSTPQDPVPASIPAASPKGSRPRVYLSSLPEADAAFARDALILAGAFEVKNPRSADLILTRVDATSLSDTVVDLSVPCVQIGVGGHIVLPGETQILTALIDSLTRTSPETSLSPPGDPTHLDAGNKRIMIAGSSGGVGTTSLVHLLATTKPHKDRRATAKDNGDTGWVVVDACGHVPGYAPVHTRTSPGVRWGDLRAGESTYLPQLREQLPLIGGVPALCGDERGGAGCADTRLAPACQALASPLLIDAGRWDDQAYTAAGALDIDVLIVIARPDESGICTHAADLARWKPPCPLITLSDTAASRRILSHLDVGRVLPLPRKRGRALRRLSSVLKEIAHE